MHHIYSVYYKSSLIITQLSCSPLRHSRLAPLLCVILPEQLISDYLTQLLSTLHFDQTEQAQASAAVSSQRLHEALHAPYSAAATGAAHRTSDSNVLLHIHCSPES